MLNDKLSYQCVGRYKDNPQYPNDSAQFNKCGLYGCAKYALIKLPQY